MNIKDTGIRYMVTILVLIVIIGLGYASLTGKTHDKKILKEQTRYTQALQFLQNQEYDQAVTLLKLVKEDYPNSATVKYYLGTSLANIREWNSAAQEYQQILDLNPYKVKEPIFMIQFAGILINAKKLDEAKIVLEKCLTLPIPEQIPNYLEQVNSLIDQISTK